MDSLTIITITITITIIISITVFSFFLYRPRRSSDRRKPPEASGKFPVIGHLRLLAGPELAHITLGALAEKFGPIFSINIGIHKAVVVSSYEVAKELFTTHDLIISSRPNTTIGRILGHNFANFGFCPYGTYWKLLRRITAAELLSPRRLELLKHVRVSEVENSIKELYKLTRKNIKSVEASVEMKKWFGDINLNVILRMIAGKRYAGNAVNSDERAVRRCRNSMRNFFQLAGTFVLRDAVPYLGWLDVGGYEKAMKQNVKELDDIFAEWLDEHKNRAAGEGKKTEQDFIDVLLSVLGDHDLEGFDVDTVCKATALMLIIGGTDTTTVTQVWALALLLNHPDELRKVQEELDTKIGKDRPVKESDIENLVYLQAVIKETLRLYPSGPLSGLREFTGDCQVSGYHIESGTRLIVNLSKMHRDPAVWEEPLVFRPQRFLTTHKEIDGKGQDFELIPFGSGRRMCPGMGFGLLMAHLGLATLVHGFEITRPPGKEAVDMTGSAGLTNIKATPLKIQIRPRLSHNAYE